MANTLSLIATVSRALRAVPDPRYDRAAGQLVFRVRGADAPEDQWDRRVVELGDGRSISEIVESIYCDELRAGAWIADIGIWKHLFARSVMELIFRLADEGCIRLKPGSWQPY